MPERLSSPDLELGTTSYDIFMSIAEADSSIAQGVTEMLRQHGLTVFVDDGSVTTEGADAEATEALKRSRLMIPFYSQRFVEESRCQRTLMTAFLAGHQNGDPLKYIAAINPDDPLSSHIVPIEICDARYETLHGLSGVIPVFENKVRENANPIGAAPVPEPPPWIGGPVSPTSPTHSTGRYAELWQVHDALEMAYYPLIRQDLMNIGRTAIISGAPGTGKTDLAATYAQLFGARYQGGVYWISLSIIVRPRKRR